MDIPQFMEPKQRKKTTKSEKKWSTYSMDSSGRVGSVCYESSMRGNRLLHYMGHKYIKNNVHGANTYWKCTKWHNGCKARAITNSTIADSCYVKNVHNHDELNMDYSQYLTTDGPSDTKIKSDQ